MPLDKINEVNIFWELTGSKGDPLVLVHGSWGDHHNWDRVIGELSKNFRVYTYDRRGHSQSERLEEQGNAQQDVSDLIALVEYLGLSPAHIAGNSFGAAITLKAAARRPDIFQTLVVHEPPLLGLLSDNPQAQSMLQIVNTRIEGVINLIEKGRNEDAAKEFVENIALGPGSWQQLPLQVQQTFSFNAPTYYDEIKDRGSLQMDIRTLSHYDKPALLTNSTESPPFFLMVLQQLVKAIPTAKRFTFEGAGHVPHMSHPQQYIKVVQEFCLENS
jgi:pimeloyl-ACP methyl ester carboxylesterase